MVTLKELQRENDRLRQGRKLLREAQDRNDRRKKLLSSNKKLAREIKFDKAIRVGRKTSAVARSVGKKTGKSVVRGGKAAFNGLIRYGKFLEEQERKQKSRNRKLRTAKKTKKPKRRK